MLNFSTYVRLFIQSLPFTGFFFVWVALMLAFPGEGFFDSKREWEEFLFLISPAVTWILVALLDAAEIYEKDAKGGRVNFVIGWALLLVALVFDRMPWGDPLSEGSQAPHYVLPVWLVLTVFSLFRLRRRPGFFREQIDRELNILRYGTTYKPAGVQDHGSARLANVRKAAKYYADGDIIFGTAKPFVPAARGLVGKVVRPFLRRKRNSVPPLLRATVSGHCLVTSGSGGGKTVSVVIPNALTYSAGSLVCIDPKGEVHAVTAKSREKIGQRVFKLKPRDPHTDTIDAIGWIDPKSENFTSDCRTVASWLFPGADDDSGGDGGSYFRKAAKAITEFTLCHQLAEWQRSADEWEASKRKLLEKAEGEIKEEDIHAKIGERPPRPTLGALYDFAYRSPSDIENDVVDVADAMKTLPLDSTHFGQATDEIRKMANALTGSEMEKTWPNTIDSLQKEISWLGNKANRSVISGRPLPGSEGKAFTASDIIDGKTSVYICLPLSVMESSPGLSRLLVGAFLNAIIAADGKAKENGTTLFLVDEMQALGKFPILHKTALNQGRGYGITLMGIIQAPEALDQQAGDKTYSSWVDNSMISMYFAIGGVETAEKISQQIGDTTVETMSYSGQVSKSRGQVLGADNGGVNISANRHGRRVLTASEILALDRSYAVVFRRMSVDDPDVGNLPMIVGTAFYEAREDLNSLASPNPFSGKGGGSPEPEGDVIEGTASEVLDTDTVDAEAALPAQARAAGEWEDVDSRAFLKQRAQQNPQTAALWDALERAEDGEDLSDEDWQAIQFACASPAVNRFDEGRLLDDMGTDELLEFGILAEEDGKELDELEREVAAVKARGRKLDEQHKQAVRAKAAAATMRDKNAEEAVRHSLAQLAALSVQVGADFSDDGAQDNKEQDAEEAGS